MPCDQFLVYYTEHGTMTFSRDLIEHRFCNAKIGLQAARNLVIDAEVLASDRLSLHPSSETWGWNVYNCHYVESLNENGVA